MDDFPINFNTQVKKQRKNIQYDLTKKVIKKFYDQIIEDNKNGLDQSILKFPSKLDFKHRKDIYEKLIDQFGKMTVTFLTPQKGLSQKTFYGYPDDYFLRDYLNENDVITMTALRVSYD